MSEFFVVLLMDSVWWNGNVNANLINRFWWMHVSCLTGGYSALLLLLYTFDMEFQMVAVVGLSWRIIETVSWFSFNFFILSLKHDLIYSVRVCHEFAAYTFNICGIGEETKDAYVSIMRLSSYLHWNLKRFDLNSFGVCFLFDNLIWLEHFFLLFFY